MQLHFITLLVLINVFVGDDGRAGKNRRVPLIGEKGSGSSPKPPSSSFIVSFRCYESHLQPALPLWVSETVGRKKLLVVGWLVGLPVPFIIIFANRWFWFDVANVLLGVNQAL